MGLFACFTYPTSIIKTLLEELVLACYSGQTNCLLLCTLRGIWKAPLLANAVRRTLYMMA